MKEGLKPMKWPRKQRQRGGGELCLLEKLIHTDYYRTNYPACVREISGEMASEVETKLLYTY